MQTGYAVGHLVDGRYRVLGRLGQGGHGVVYECEDAQLGSRVAIKCLNAFVAAEPGFKTRMQREARAMGTLSGTSAVQIFDFNKADDGTMYIVMELLKGRDLAAYLEDLEAHGGRLSAAKLVELVGPIVDTLEQAHAEGIIHRDLKPGNIFVLDNFARGGVRLLDFGLAKDMKAEPLTQEGMIAGSPAYIAPEVWKGKPQEVDHRIDVYSLGAVMFRALGGSPPFGTSKDTIDQLLIAVTRGPRPSLHSIRRDLPPTIDAWVQKALAIQPADRFASCRALWNAFRALTEGSVSREGPPSSVDIDLDFEG